MPLVYAELHRLAHFQLGRERPGVTLQTSALVNEAYLRLIDANRIDWQDRAHFFAITAKIIRQVLMQNARLRHARKRGGSVVRVEIQGGLLGRLLPLLRRVPQHGNQVSLGVHHNQVIQFARAQLRGGDAGRRSVRSKKCGGPELAVAQSRQ